MIRRRAQTLLEYVVVVSCVILILSVMGYYMRNVLIGKHRENAAILSPGDVYYIPPLDGPGSVIEENIITNN